MDNKTCTSCNNLKPVSEFYRDRTAIRIISYRSKCKECSKLYQSKRTKNDTHPLLTKKCSICDTDKPIQEYYKSYRHTDGYFKWCAICHEKKVRTADKNNPRNRIKRTPEYMIEYNKKRKLDINYALRYQIKGNLHTYLRRNIKASKNNSVLKYMGCSILFLKAWFEYNFDENMTWDNRGLYWHIDHITPCASFDLSNQEQIYKCYNWTNLRPLERSENISKSDGIYKAIISEYEVKAKNFLNQIDYVIHEDMYVLLPEVKTLNTPTKAS